MNTPLAERMRPKTLSDYIGQTHLIAKGKPLRHFIEKGLLPSIILWGPPGVGKTTLATIISHTLKTPFYTLSAINSGVKEVREIIEKAKSQAFFGQNKPVLFIDEIHRFSKSQQDSLLGAVEKGTVTLIGATTENPSFEVIPALLSRCQVFVLEHLSKKELEDLLHQAVEKDEFLSLKKIELKETDFLLRISGGDARKLLNALEIVVHAATSNTVIITNQTAQESLMNNLSLYDKSGEMHYDIISAFIKSIRGSDPNAAVYWLARMIEGGEDIKFIARRLVILASEDIGNANPTALIMATNCFQAVSLIGYPEGRIILSQCATYLACSPKSNACYEAINKAMQLVKEKTNLPVPLHLRNAPTKLMKDLHYGENYQYAHAHEQNFVTQEFLPNEIAHTQLYNPGANARENELRAYLKHLWKDKYGY
ncbi:MAG: replication-associated recombination protein A [Bacteroidetes bacterium]|nr:replication-associated recombination protein A [Bacteroidota bacterium]